MVNRDIACAHANILAKFQDLFPSHFIDAVREGCSWLCTHNNITYQTSIMVASDRVIVDTPSASILRVGLIDTIKPLSGLTYYDVVSVTETTDKISNQVVFTVKMKYNTPMGLTITLIPYNYYNYGQTDINAYTKEEVDKLISSLRADIKLNATIIESNVNELTANKEADNVLLAQVNVLKAEIEAIKAGNIHIDNGATVAGLPIASESTLGGIKIGQGILIDATTGVATVDQDAYLSKVDGIAAIDLKVSEKANKTDLDNLVTEVKDIETQLTEFVASTTKTLEELKASSGSGGTTVDPNAPTVDQTTTDSLQIVGVDGGVQNSFQTQIPDGATLTATFDSGKVTVS